MTSEQIVRAFAQLAVEIYSDGETSVDKCVEQLCELAKDYAIADHLGVWPRVDETLESHEPSKDVTRILE